MALTNGRLRFSSKDTAFRSITSHLCPGSLGAVVLCSGIGSDESLARGGLQDAPEWCGGTCGLAWSRILQSAVPSREGDRLESSHRFVNIKRIRHSDKVPYGDGCVCSWVYSSRGLDVHH